MVTSSQTTMAQAMPIMMLTQDFEPDEIPVLKLQQTYDNDSVVKVEIPIIDGRTVEANLYGLNEFLEAAEELTFEREMNCFKHFARFSKVQSNRIGIQWSMIMVSPTSLVAPQLNLKSVSVHGN
jgi:hypothetical protein